MTHLTTAPPAGAVRAESARSAAGHTATPQATGAGSGMLDHPTGRRLPHLVAVPDLAPAPPADRADEDGSLVAEYGLLAVVAATVAGVLISWAGSGALAGFFTELLSHARSLVVS
ncbi:MAG: hypothetical protein WEB09_05640 [Nitriliruptor sp.]